VVQTVGYHLQLVSSALLLYPASVMLAMTSLDDDVLLDVIHRCLAPTVAAPPVVPVVAVVVVADVSAPEFSPVVPPVAGGTLCVFPCGRVVTLSACGPVPAWWVLRAPRGPLFGRSVAKHCSMRRE